MTRAWRGGEPLPGVRVVRAHWLASGVVIFSSIVLLKSKSPAAEIDTTRHPLVVCPQAPPPLPSSAPTQPQGPSAEGRGSVDAFANYAVSVTPKGSSVTWIANTNGHTSTFTVTNTGTCQDSYNFTPSTTGPVSGVTLNKTSATLAAGTNTTVIATYNVGAPGTGTLTLTAFAGTGGEQDAGYFSVTVTPAPVYGVSVTPDGATSSRFANIGGYQEAFTIQSSANVTDTFTVSCGGSSNVTCTGVSAATVVLPAGASKVDTAIYSTGAAGTGSLVLRAASAHASDSGSYVVNVVAGTPQSPVVVLDSVNPGATVDRSLCLTVAIGLGAAIECGDLRLVHALPTTRTRNRVHTPMLLYNSSQAHPYPIVAVNVSVPSGGGGPDSVVATLRVGSLGQVDRRSWPGNGWSPNRATRVALGFDAYALGVVTGLYADTVQVTFWYSGTPQNSTGTSRLTVVNRATSTFGAGWWLDGMEQVLFNTGDSLKIWWIGGDNSFREYTRAAGSSVYRAPNIDRPDSIVRIGPTGSYTYWRYLPHGAKVGFDNAGRHLATVNRLSDTTAFRYDASGRLDTIALAPISPRKLYLFVYSANLLQSVSAPAANRGGTAVSRVVTITTSGGRVTQIQDPDNTTVGFGYVAGDTNRIYARTDRRGTPTSFAYDAGKRVSKDSLSLGGGQFIVETFRAIESQGLAAAVDTALAYSSLNGPRTDVGDTTSFWVDRFGAPRKIRDAQGDTTLIRRGDANWPALVTRVAYANGRVVSAAYDSHGNIISATDSSSSQGGRYATTTYRWDMVWDFVSGVFPPGNDSVTIAYDPSNGNRTSQQDARGTSSITRFYYYASGPGAGLAQSIQTPAESLPGSPRDSIVYDVLGNVDSLKTPLGFWTAFYRDRIGRDTLERRPTDSSQTKFQVERTAYDLMDRDTLGVTLGGPDTVPIYNSKPSFIIPAESTVVRKHYNTEGSLDTLSRIAGPDQNSVGWMRTSWAYDLANRRVTEVAPDGKIDSSYYDPSSNVVRSVTRRGHWITKTYDALNRLVQSIIPSASYPNDTITCSPGYPPPCPGRFPFYHIGSTPGHGLVIAADTLVFSYDSVGNLRSANNHDARIARRYNLNGTLAADTLRVRTYAELGAGGDTTTHSYGIRYGYDLDGRRTWMKHPATIAPAGQDSVAYTYTVAGQLASVRDILGNMYRLVFDVEGRLDSVIAPGGAFEKRVYDGDSRVHSRYDYGTGVINDDTMSYDARGKVLSVFHVPSLTQLRNWYSGLGYLLRAQNEGADIINTDDTHPDALGNPFETYRWGSPNVDYNAYAYQSGTGRLLKFYQNNGGAADTLRSLYDPAGNRYWQDNYRPISLGGNSQDLTASYYDAAQRLRYSEHLTFGRLHSKDGGAWEEYRYDALGRRVLVRARRDSTAGDCGQPPPNNICYPVTRNSYIQRSIWDGNDLLYEIQAPGGDLETAARLEADTAFIDTLSAPYGRVAYTNASQIDHPLGIVRIGYSFGISGYPGWPGPVAFTPHWSWRGLGQQGTLMNGQRDNTQCQTSGGSSRCWAIDWPALTTEAGLGRSPAVPAEWFGTSIPQQRDLSQQLYMRNRYYDPATGRFTQEDPIGLAGGLNLYGFAGGDPVTFTDPFGLGPDTVQIGWRPLHNLAGCCYVHFAIRVGGGNNWHADELLPDPDDSKNNIVPFNGSGSQADEYTWTTVPVPEGQTSTEFDRNTLRAVGTVGATYAGREYTNHSKGNSNKFIYDVVNAAGGKVPKSAAQSPAPNRT